MNEQFVYEPNEKPRILIVDNNSKFARSARLVLDQSGKYVACTVIDPRRALEAARSFKPDLVLADLIMPQEDGPEVAAQFEADWALHGVPIAFPYFSDHSGGSKRWSSRLRASNSFETDKQLTALGIRRAKPAVLRRGLNFWGRATAATQLALTAFQAAN